MGGGGGGLATRDTEPYIYIYFLLKIGDLPARYVSLLEGGALFLFYWLLWV